MTKPLSLSDVAKKKLPKVAVENFSQFITERIYSNLLHPSKWKRTPGLHLSSLLPDCMRMTGYKILFGSHMNMQGIYKTGIGTFLHDAIKILEVQELPLEWEGIVTDGVDEYDPETGVWIDKKFTWGPPNWDMWPNNRRQLEYIKNMLIENKNKATHGFIVYFDLSAPRFHIRYGKNLRTLKVISAEMLKKRDICYKVRKTAILPERKISKECTFCSHAVTCLREVL